MKPGIGKDYASLCSQQSPFTDYLFGDDLRKQLKDLSDVNKKVGAKVQASRGSQRSRSGYGNTSSSRGSFFSQTALKKLQNQTYQPWWNKELYKKKPNNKRQS